MTRGEYLRSFDRVNLLYEFPGRASGGDRFPMRDARVAARAITPFLRGRIVVFVGRNVARAFGFGGEVASFFDWHFAPVDGYAFAIVPHPSGRNRWFNDDGRILIFKEFSRTLTSRSAPSIVSKGELPTPS